MTTGLLEAIITSVGEEVTALNGSYHTKLASDASAGDTSITVISTYGWPDTGRATIDGITYRFTGKTNTTITGITYLQSGVEFTGLKTAHAENTLVADTSRTVSAVDQIRHATLVNYAEGDDLNVIGRNLSVPRAPLISSDDLYREIIKALGYNPRGTIYGMELALTALVGEGNFQIIENLENEKNKIVFEIAGDVQTTDSYAGKPYLNETITVLADSSTEADLGTEPLTVYNLTLAATTLSTDTRSAKPSTQTYVEYTGDAGEQAWYFTGSSESSDVTLTVTDGGEIEIEPTGSSALYDRPCRLNKDSDVDLSVYGNIVTIYNSGATVGGLQACLRIDDGTRSIVAGCFYDDGVNYNLGFCDDSGNLLSSTVSLIHDQYYTITLKKRGQTSIELWVDGNKQLSIDYTDFDPTTLYSASYGCELVDTTSPVIRVKHTDLFITTPTDYWNVEAYTGATNAGTPTVLNSGFTLYDANAGGKNVLIKGSSVTNPYGGNNNGVYTITNFLTVQNVNLTGLTGVDATLDTSNPTRIILSDDFLTYPDDLGKTITLSESELGNNGAYTITKLLEPGTLTDLSTYNTPNTETTSICEVSSATFTTELNISWQLDPVFVTETGLHFISSDHGSVSGTDVSWVTALANYDSATESARKIVTAIITKIPTAQLVESTIANEVTNDDPLEYSYYPFYLNDPIGYVEYYMDDLTAAGVIPVYRLV